MKTVGIISQFIKTPVILLTKQLNAILINVNKIN